MKTAARDFILNSKHPFVATDQNLAHIADPEATQFRAKQIEMLYEQSHVAMAASVAAALILILALWAVAPHGILIAWADFLLLATVLRLALARCYARATDRSKRSNIWLTRFVIGLGASGATWGTTTILLVPDGAFVHTGLVALWVCGLSAGAVATFSIIKRAFFAFSIPAMLPGALYLIKNGGANATVGGAQLLFLVFISLSALRMHKTLTQNLTLQLQNILLIKYLDSEKHQIKKLNTQLEKRVLERTSELARVNIDLKKDISERQRTEQALFAEKERAQVTLHSIGDGVITTDAEGIVEYINPIAEKLTGWQCNEAQGLPLARVFRVINEQTRQPVIDPVAQCLEKNCIVEIAGHSVLINRGGQEYAIQDSAAPIRGRDGTVLGVVLVFSDVTEARQMARQMAYQAVHDSLTGLVNRREFEQRLQRLLETAKAKPVEHALCYLDLDQFKIINDTYGHIAGDELLRQISEVIGKRIRRRDTLARLGGDEFGILLEYCSLERAQQLANTIRKAVEDFRFVWENKSFNIGVSIGLVPITMASINITTVLKAADTACYAAKDKGRNCIRVYREDDRELARRQGEMQWVTRIQHALEENRFHIYSQPITPIAAEEDEKCYELLLRLEDETGNLVLPSAFLPAAERYNLATKIDSWVVSNAFTWLAKNSEQRRKCFINLSGHSLGNKAFLAFIIEQFGKIHLSPSQICFEITETAAIANLSNATRFIKSLKTY